MALSAAAAVIKSTLSESSESEVESEEESSDHEAKRHKSSGGCMFYYDSSLQENCPSDKEYTVCGEARMEGSEFCEEHKSTAKTGGKLLKAKLEKVKAKEVSEFNG